MPCGRFSVPCSGFASFPSVLRRHAFTFDPDQPFAVPDPGVLLPQVLEWIQSAEVRLGLEFYPAEGGPPIAVPRMPARKAKTARKPGDGVTEGGKQKAKRVTTAQLLDSIQDLMSSLPERQKLLEDRVTVTGPASCHALSQPLSNAMPGPRLAPSAVVSQIQTPPRTSHAKNPGLLLSPALAKPQELLELEKEKPGSAEVISNDMLAQAVLAQSTALNNLESQIAQSSSDPMMDLWGLSVTGTRGSRLQTELASQKGLFFQSVMQAMARRMSPTVPVEGDYRPLMDRGVCGTKYLERFGGYYKNRDLGMLMYTKFKTGMPPGTPRRFSVSPLNRQPSTGAGSNWPVSCALRTICHQAFLSTGRQLP